ncbi:hypothetical protein ACI2K4_24120 [Micromonospora sp. NPDC050397]|uniref:hypothetical protein n=1 Tax=Micromonospora sp. NPDC050397 TaxID=3364279 RepID=UPI00384AA8B5
MRPLDVDPGSLRSAAAVLAEAVDALDQLAVDFETRLAGLGEPWGTDEIGSLIGRCYLPAVDAAVACLDANAAELDRYGENLARMADSYDQTDDSGRLGFDALQQRLTGY